MLALAKPGGLTCPFTLLLSQRTIIPPYPAHKSPPALFFALCYKLAFLNIT